MLSKIEITYGKPFKNAKNVFFSSKNVVTQNQLGRISWSDHQKKLRARIRALWVGEKPLFKSEQKLSGQKRLRGMQSGP